MALALPEDGALVESSDSHGSLASTTTTTTDEASSAMDPVTRLTMRRAAAQEHDEQSAGAAAGSGSAGGEDQSPASRAGAVISSVVNMISDRLDRESDSDNEGETIVTAAKKKTLGFFNRVKQRVSNRSEDATPAAASTVAGGGSGSQLLSAASSTGSSPISPPLQLAAPLPPSSLSAAPTLSNGSGSASVGSDLPMLGDDDGHQKYIKMHGGRDKKTFGRLLRVQDLEVRFVRVRL